MNLFEAINACRETKRSKTFILASNARDLPDKLEWLKSVLGNKPIMEIMAVWNHKN